MELILASVSVARRTMLTQAGITARFLPSHVDESALKASFKGPPPALALALAEAKAQSVAQAHKEAFVIGADQLLVCNAKIFDKPADLTEAAAHLRALSGQMHELVTAVCVTQGGEMRWRHVERVRLTMRPLSEALIARYLEAEGQEILGCVGAYRLEGWGAQLFEQVEGDYFAVLGLPLLPLLGFLRGAGLLEA